MPDHPDDLDYFGRGPSSSRDAGGDEDPADADPAERDAGPGAHGEHEAFGPTTDAHRTVRVAGWAIVLSLLLPVVVLVAVMRAQGTGLEAESTAAAQVGQVVVLDDGAYSLWARNLDGSAVRWNSCEPIRWTFNPNGAPLGAVEELQRAMERITAVSGIEFEYLGETDELPTRNRSPWLPERYDRTRWAPVLVAWRTPATTDAPLGEHDRAVAIPVAVGTSEQRTFVTAQVVFNQDLAGTPGFNDRRRSIGITMLHELLHVIGLGHVDDTREIMFPFPVAGSADFGAGDLAGMEAVGSAHGCLEVPEPADIEVSYAE